MLHSAVIMETERLLTRQQPGSSDNDGESENAAHSVYSPTVKDNYRSSGHDNDDDDDDDDRNLSVVNDAEEDVILEHGMTASFDRGSHATRYFNN